MVLIVIYISDRINTDLERYLAESVFNKMLICVLSILYVAFWFTKFDE